jgi:hypothetical protein
VSAFLLLLGLVGGRPRQADARRRVRADEALLERSCEKRPYRREREPNRVPGAALGRNRGDVTFYVPRFDLGKTQPAEEWDRALLHDPPIVSERRLAHAARRPARVALEPFGRVLRERHM